MSERAQAHAVVQHVGLPRDGRGAAGPTPRTSPSPIPQGGRADHRRPRRSTTRRRTCAGTCSPRRARAAGRRSSTRTSRFYGDGADRREGAAAAVEALRGRRDSDLGEALGKAYVEQTFGPRPRPTRSQMVQEIEAALRPGHQRDLTWMTPTRRQQALVKLRAVANKIGYPEQWRDYARSGSSAATRSATPSGRTPSSTGAAWQRSASRSTRASGR